MCNDYTLPLGWQLGTTALWRSRGVWKTLPSSSVRRLAVASDASACRLTVQQDPSDRRPDRETRSPIILTPGTPRASLYFGGSVHADDRSESCHRSPTPGPRVRGLLELRRVDSRFGAGDRLQSFFEPRRKCVASQLAPGIGEAVVFAYSLSPQRGGSAARDRPRQWQSLPGQGVAVPAIGCDRRSTHGFTAGWSKSRTASEVEQGKSFPRRRRTARRTDPMVASIGYEDCDECPHAPLL